MPSQRDADATIDAMLDNAIEATHEDRTTLLMRWRELVRERDMLDLKITALEHIIRAKDQRDRMSTGDVR